MGKKYPHICGSHFKPSVLYLGRRKKFNSGIFGLLFLRLGTLYSKRPSRYRVRQSASNQTKQTFCVGRAANTLRILPHRGSGVAICTATCTNFCHVRILPVRRPASIFKLCLDIRFKRRMVPVGAQYNRLYFLRTGIYKFLIAIP